MNINIACGGTGGHIFPGMAVGRVLQKRGHEVILWLSSRAVESVSVQGWDGPVISLDVEGFPSGILFLKALRPVLKAFSASARCKKIMSKQKPDVLLAMGSYASVGPVMAARSLRVPVVLHESNSVPGRAVSFLSRFARCVAVNFSSAESHLPNAGKVIRTGMPVRNFGSTRFDSQCLDPNIFTVFVSGGSQGASRLNDICSAALCRLHKEGTRLQVIHSTGIRDVDMVLARYQNCGIPNLTDSFITDIEKAYNSSNIAICRAGASTCAELLHFRLPALLVPLPSAKRNHQEMNAKEMVSYGICDIVLERELTPEYLSGYLKKYLKNPSRLEKMRESSVIFAENNATIELANLVERVAKGEI